MCTGPTGCREACRASGCARSCAPPGPCSRLWAAIFPGFLDGQLLNNADLPTNVSRLKYETISLVAIGVTMIAGFIFYWLGAPTRAASADVPLEGNESMVPQTAGE